MSDNELEEIDKWLDNEYGVSYTRLEELHDFLIEQNMKYQDKNDNLQQENKQLKETIDKLENYIEQIRKMLYKRHLDDYDVYTANVLCDMQSEFEEILRGE